MLVLCDFERLATPEAVYDYLQQELSFPDWFGRNLDALYDALTEIGNGWDVRFTGCGLIRESLPAYMDALARLCRQAREEMENLTVTFED